MKRAFILLPFLVAYPLVAMADARPTVSPVLVVSVQSGLRAPDPACTCASVESFPAPSKYEAECTGGAVCEEIHYSHYLARKRTPGALGVLLATHYVQSRVYDATISFSARGGHSTFRVSVGDIVPDAAWTCARRAGASVVRRELGRRVRDASLARGDA